MGVGKGGKEAKAPLDLKNFRKKGCFLSVEWEKTNFTIFGPPWKKFGKNPCAPPPWKKSFPRPWFYYVSLADRESISKMF